MSYPEYHADLQRIHDSEVYGAAVFDTAARLTRDAGRKRKWLLLKGLEEQTLARYLEYMQRTRQPVTEPRAWAARGRVDGAGLALMPWGAAMKLLARGTQPFMERFQRLQDHAAGPERAFFAYVCAHERAIEAFANGELAGDGDSLRDVEALLSGGG